MADEGFKRKLTAILSADVEGNNRLIGDDEEATVRTLTSYREVLTTLIQQHSGKVLHSPADNLLTEFVSVVDAVQCAVDVQKEIKARNDPNQDYLVNGISDRIITGLSIIPQMFVIAKGREMA